LATSASTTEELLVGLDGICKLLAADLEIWEPHTLLIDLLASNVLLILSEIAQDIGEHSRVSSTACVLSCVMCSATQVIAISTSITPTSTIA
jgi:hypothetical protein